MKTIKAMVDFNQLQGLLTEYIRKLPNYTRVEADAFIFRTNYEGSITIELRNPKEVVCSVCEGKGKDSWNEKEPCFFCRGTGKTTDFNSTRAKLMAQLDGSIKIEVNAEGNKPESWKPEVDKLKTFIENLVGKPCIVIPNRRKKPRLEIKSISEIVNLETFAQRESTPP